MKSLITGASSGIGKNMAYYLASKNIDLILVARNKKEMERIKKELNVNVFESNLKKALNSAGMKYARKIITGEEFPDESIFCKKCCIYIDRQKNNNFINQRKIKYS